MIGHPELRRTIYIVQKQFGSIAEVDMRKRIPTELAVAAESAC
jgi:hypothetical protein